MWLCSCTCEHYVEILGNMNADMSQQFDVAVKNNDSTCSSIANNSSCLLSTGPGHVLGPILSTLHVLTPSVFTTSFQGSSPLYRYRNRGSERLKTLPRITAARL